MAFRRQKERAPYTGGKFNLFILVSVSVPRTEELTTEFFIHCDIDELKNISEGRSFAIKNVVGIYFILFFSIILCIHNLFFNQSFEFKPIV